MDSTVRVWDARTGQENLSIKAHSRNVHCVAFSPDGKLLATCGLDRKVKLWDARTGKEVVTLKEYSRNADTVAFSPDGKLIAANGDQKVTFWDAQTAQEVRTFTGDAEGIGRITFSRDWKRLASRSQDETVRIWNAHTAQLNLTLRGHTHWVEDMAFTPDGNRLATSSADGTVKIWEVQTGQTALTLKGASSFGKLAFSPDGKRLASACVDGTVKVWDVTPINKVSPIQRQALSYYRFLAETVVLKDDMIQQARRTPVLDEPVREQVLAFMKDYHENADRLNTVSWSGVRNSWARLGAHALALRQAEAACRKEPGNGVYLRTLGAAQYRNGQYAAALKTLTEADKRNGTRFGPSPLDLTFLAMTRFHLGQKAEAAATLGRLREAMKTSPFDRDVEELLKEAESVVEAKK
jgi:WD40 repeat protein